MCCKSPERLHSTVLTSISGSMQAYTLLIRSSASRRIRIYLHSYVGCKVWLQCHRVFSLALFVSSFINVSQI